MGIIFGVAFGLTLYLESAYRGYSRILEGGRFQHPVNMLINCILFMGMISALNLVLPMQFGVGLVVALGIGLGYGNKYKVAFRGDNLFPWDLKLGKEGSDMAGYLDMRGVALDLVIAAAIIVIAVLFAGDAELSRSNAMTISILSLLVMGVCWISHQELPVIDQFSFYAHKGMLLAFLLNIKEMTQFSGVSLDDRTQHLDDTYNACDGQADEACDKPNVIVIMNESFWDPSRLDQAEFSRPLTPVLDEIRRKGISGDLVSPEFGGGTSNIEFEMLTGNSMFFLPTGTMAFQSFLNKQVEALPSLFKKQGYRTIGLHSYERWFWNRVEAYKNMGFDAFMSSETFVNPELKGPYISDRTFSEKVIEVYESTEGPLFLFGVTMQNHGPYDVKRYESYDIDVIAPISSKELGHLKCYAQGVADADQALGDLVNYFSSQEAPTILVFFGDHLPMLGKNFSVFKDCGYIKSQDPLKWSEEEKLRMASIPFGIWSNKGLEPKDIGSVSPARLGLEILKQVPMVDSSHFRHLHQIYEVHPVINKRVYNPGRIEKEGKELLDRYQILQNRMLFEE